MSSHDSLNSRLTELTRQLNQKDAELDQEVDDIMAADFEALDADIEADKKDLRDGLKQKVEAVKKGIKDRKDDLRQRVEAAKTGAKDRARKEAEDSLNRMEEHLSNDDLVSAHVSRWVASQWLKASKSLGYFFSFILFLLNSPLSHRFFLNLSIPFSKYSITLALFLFS